MDLWLSITLPSLALLYTISSYFGHIHLSTLSLISLCYFFSASFPGLHLSIYCGYDPAMQCPGVYASPDFSTGFPYLPYWTAASQTDTAIYYISLATVLAVSWSSKRIKPLSNALSRPVRLPTRSGHIRTNPAILLFYVLLLYLLLRTFLSQYFSKKSAETYADTSDLFATAVASGHVATLLIALQVLPVTRNGLLWSAFSAPNRPLHLHRTLGGLCVLVVTIHFALIQAVCLRDSVWWRQTVEYVQSNPGSAYAPWPWVIPMMSTLYLFMWAVIWWQVIVPTTRRLSYKRFKLLHIGTGYLFLAGAAVHAWDAWHFLLLGAVLQLHDYVVRAVQTVTTTAVDDVCLEVRGPVCCVTLNVGLPDTTRFGSYVMLRSKTLGMEAHPFTVAMFDRNMTRFYIKMQGENQWTRRLENRARAGEGVELTMEGPYEGAHRKLLESEKILCVVGGVGVTPAVAVVDAIKGTAGASVTVVWVVRERGMVAALSEFVEMCQQAANAELVVHYTGGEGQEKAGEGVREKLLDDYASDALERGVEVFQGRPNLQRLFGENEGAAVLCCGPAGLVAECSELAFKHGNGFYSEEFAW